MNADKKCIRKKINTFGHNAFLALALIMIETENLIKMFDERPNKIDNRKRQRGEKIIMINNGKWILLHFYSSSIASFRISIERNACMSELHHSSCTEWKKKKLYVEVKRELLVFSFYFVFAQHWMISSFEIYISSI